jgi:hypothetical protein
MRVGLHFGPLQDFAPIGKIIEMVQKAENFGFNPILFADSVSLSRFHVHDPIPPSPSPLRRPAPRLSALV